MQWFSSALIETVKETHNCTHTNTQAHTRALMEEQAEVIHLAHTHAGTPLHRLPAIRAKMMKCACACTHTRAHARTVISLFASQLVELICLPEGNSPRSPFNQHVLISLCACLLLCVWLPPRWRARTCFIIACECRWPRRGLICIIFFFFFFKQCECSTWAQCSSALHSNPMSHWLHSSTDAPAAPAAARRPGFTAH